MKLSTTSRLLVLLFLASINAIQAVENDAASKVNSSSSLLQKKDSFLKDYRALQEQKLNDFKAAIKEKKRSRDLITDEAMQLLSCFDLTYSPQDYSITYSVNKNDYDILSYTYGENVCNEGFKTATDDDFVSCNEITGGILVKNGKRCIPDEEFCPDDYDSLLRAVADAIGVEIFSILAEYYSKDTCLLPQCFAEPFKEVTVNWQSFEEYPASPYTCPEIGGSCEVDCEDDDYFFCIPGLCFANKDYDADYYPSLNYYSDPAAAEATTKSLTNTSYLRPFKNAGGGRQLKASKSSKGSKAVKSSKGSKASKSSKTGNSENDTGNGECTCKVPRARNNYY